MSIMDLREELSSRLKVKLASCSMEEYFSNHLYIGDLKTVKSVVNSKNEEQEAFFKYIKTKLSATVDKIERVYTHLFSSSYEVIKPVGILCSEGILKVGKGGVLECQDDMEAIQAYSVLMQALGYRESSSLDFDSAEILQTYGSNTRPLYYPRKMLEFAFGRVGSREDGTYKRTSDAKSWELYWEKQVKPKIEARCKKIIWSYFVQRGLIQNKRYRAPENVTTVSSELDSLLEHIYRNLTSCILVITMSKTKTGDKFTDIKFRCADLDHQIPLNMTIPKRLVEVCFNKNIGTEDARYESVVPVLPGADNYFVVDVRHKFDPKMADATPLFAYTALDALANSGKTISWDNLILGKRDDDSILTVGKGRKIDFSIRFMHWIIAGSRSGKGVMTLNILASALASMKPVFYLDNKPDMLSMLRSAKLSGGKMFGVNGDYQASFDSEFNTCDPVNNFNWKKNIPEYLYGNLGNSYPDFSPLFYMRAVLFMLSLIYVRGSVQSKEDKFNLLGGKNGVICVIDEVLAGSDGIRTMMSTRFGKAYYHNSVLNQARSGKTSSKVEFSEFGCYSTDLFNCVNATALTLLGWKQKGLQGGGTEGERSDIFILGQKIPMTLDLAKTSYLPTVDGRLNATSGDVFYNLLFDFGPKDIFLGFNIDEPGYMDTGDGSTSKAATRLTAYARNFAYVKNFNIDTVDKMLAGKARSISDNALYFKPFLIFNDGKEEGPYVKDGLSAACNAAGLDFSEVKDANRRKDGVLMPEIGFIPYIEKMASLGGSEVAKSIAEVLAQSYDIANVLVQAYIPGYDGDCVDFIYDLRPEAMFTAEGLLAAFDRNEHISGCPVHDEFFGNGASAGSVDTDGVGDLNDFDEFLSPEEPVEEGFIKEDPIGTSFDTPQEEPISQSSTFDMYSDMDFADPDPIESEVPIGQPTPTQEDIVWSSQVRYSVARLLALKVYGALQVDNQDLLTAMIETAYNDLVERGY